MDPYSVFSVLFSNKFLKPTEVNKLFDICKEKKSDESRIKYMMKLWKKFDFKSTVYKESKNAKSSEAARKQGNELYTAASLTEEKCFEVLELYSKSIAYAPMGSREQAVAFSNRSAVLCRMKKYVECLLDIERAIALDVLPPALRSKLDQRQKECLDALKDSTRDDPIKKSMDWFTDMSIDHHSDYPKFYYHMKYLTKEEVPEEDNPSRLLKHFAVTMEEPNPEVPCASDVVAINYNKKYGRHLVATRNIEPGEIFAVEKPYAMMLSEGLIRNHCHHCLQLCQATIPCNSCTYAMYCSEECKTADWKASHDIECPIFHALHLLHFDLRDRMTLRLTILAIRRSGGIKNLKEIMKEVDEQTDMRTKGFSKDGVYQSDQYRSVYSLLTNTEKRTGLDIFRSTYISSVLVYLVSVSPNQTLIPKDAAAFVFVGALMLRHHQILALYANQLCHYKEKVPVSYMVLEPFTSLASHSCFSNMDQMFELGCSLTVARYPIKKGEQILAEYQVRFNSLEKASRQKYLFGTYQFMCDCQACCEDWPTTEFLKSYKDLVPCYTKRKRIAVALHIWYSIVHQCKPQTLERAELLKLKQIMLHTIRVMYDNAPISCLEMQVLLDVRLRSSSETSVTRNT